MIYEATIEIERPIDEVFELLTCRRRCVVWTSMYNSQMDSDDPAHIGSTFTWEERLFGRPYSFKGMITELEPPHLFTIKTIGGPVYKTSYIFTSTERGTLVHRVVEFEALPAPYQGMVDEELVKAGLLNILKLENQQSKLVLENDLDLWALMSA